MENKVTSTKAKAMTQRDFLNAVIKADVSKDITDYAKSAIVKLDEKNANRKVSKSAVKHKAENDNVKSAILAFMKPNTVYTCAQLADATGQSTQKISALMRQIDESVVTILDVKVVGKGKCKGYRLAQSTPATAEVDVPTEG